MPNDYHGFEWRSRLSWPELMLVGAAVKLGVFAALSGEVRDAAAVAAVIGGDRRATERLLDALVELKYLAQEADGYALTPESRRTLADPDSEDYLGFAVLHSHRLAERWLTLPDVVRSGEPAPGDRFSETVEGFIRAMDIYARVTADSVVAHCLAHAEGARTALDIGGATGTIARRLAAAGLRVTLLDVPDAVAAVAADLEPLGITAVAGDFNVSLPDGPFDLVFLGNVVHIYSPDHNRALFKRAAASLVNGGTIAILDWVGGRSPSAAMFAVNMLVNTEAGGTWTEDQYREWLTAAGFVEPRVIDLAERDQQLILATLNAG